MAAELIDGKAIAGQIRQELTKTVQELKAQRNASVGLCVVLVGQRADSATYVRMKQRACAEVGIESFKEELPDTVSQQELEQVVTRYNQDSRVHGILVQLPLPGHIEEKAVLQCISPGKDVDGFLPDNIGRLALRGYTAPFVSCTPLGCIEMLKRTNTPIQGKHAVVVGRSNIVGMPLALLLLEENATVTICHSRTADLPEQVSRADIVVAAIGKPGFVRGDWIKQGAVVIDVGINSVDDPSAPRGYRLVGDVEFDTAQQRASKITPVPGGVGPMTIAMLLRNTVNSALRHLNAGSQ